MSNVLYVEALKNAQTVTTFRPTFKVFAAGGITGCPDWQLEMLRRLTLLAGWEGDNLPDIMLMNPRRANFPMDDPTAAKSQITWEYNHLRQADAISFWFCEEQIQPIVLFEYGYWLGQPKTLIVGVHPKYPRREDVYMQTSLERLPRQRHADFLGLYGDINEVCVAICQAARWWMDRQ